MKYKGFFVKITPDNYLPRENEDGEIVACEGFRIEVFADESEKVEIDIFSAAVDFELMKNSINEVEQFAKDYIDSEEKEYCRMLDEFNKDTYQRTCNVSHCSRYVCNTCIFSASKSDGRNGVYNSGCKTFTGFFVGKTNRNRSYRKSL